MELEKIYNNLFTFYNMNYRKYMLTDPRFYLNDALQLTWYNHITNESFENYEQYYDWVFDNVQYSLKLDDDSLLQFFFEAEREGKKNHAKKGSMAYLPNPRNYSEYFRFDVDLKREENYVHTSYHIHFGYRSKNVRFTLNRFPMPSEFVRFIFFLHYGEWVEEFNKNNFWETLEERNIKYNHALDFRCHDT